LQELTENKENSSAFEHNKFLSKDGKPRELFLSSDANVVVEHTKKVLVIEDGEVVHLKLQTAPSFFNVALASQSVFISRYCNLWQIFREYVFFCKDCFYDFLADHFSIPCTLFFLVR